MAVQTQHMTVEEFDRLVERPDNADRLFEYIGGEMVEVVSNQRSSAIAYRLGGFLSMYLMHSGAGFLTGADGGYMIAGERYLPDVAFVSQARQARPSEEAYSPVPPDLAVEVLSPSNKPKDVRIKIGNYLAAGSVLWVVDPDQKQVEVYVPGQAVKRLGEKDTLDGGDVLPGFTLAIKDIFPE
jgi:Uma2 family endonuclease